MHHVHATAALQADEMKTALEASGVRVATDYRDNYTPG